MAQLEHELEGRLDQVTSRDAFQPQPFCNSVNCNVAMTLYFFSPTGYLLLPWPCILTPTKRTVQT